MELYKNKNIDFGFIILCLDYNKGNLNTTVRSLKNYYPDSKFIGVSPKKDNDLQLICPNLFYCDEKITSFINVGFKNAPSEWNMIVIAGNWMRSKLCEKYSLFIENKKDILFPIAGNERPFGRKRNFIDGTINGVLMHKDAFKEIGDFYDIEDSYSEGKLEISKTLWAFEAVTKGYRFKAILGAKLI